MALKAPVSYTGNKASDPDKVDPLREAMHWMLHWWQDAVHEIDHVAVIAKVHSDSYLTGRYVFMTCMSAGIAILGLLLSSPAVVIGAMLLSPLMGPILGAGFALAIGDVRWLRECGIALAVGIIVAILFCAAIVLVSPLDTVTEEIAARTRPNLFDLGVALFSALAGAYAMIKGREGTIVGVAIATALMPPLAVVGFGLATANGVILGGSLLLFFTNLMTIALTAAVMARLNGFRSALSAQQTLWQSIVAIAVFIVLAVPLGLALQQVAWETNAARRANSVVASEFSAKARVSQLDIDYVSDPIALNATVLTPELEPEASARIERLLEKDLGVPISVAINQYRVGTDDQDVQNAELAAAKLQAQSIERDQRISSMVETLALVAGVSTDDVFVDQTKKRIVAQAKPLPGANMASYYTLEKRMADRDPEWRFIITPPAMSLPEIRLDENGAIANNDASYALCLWAIKRVNAPVAITGNENAADAVIAQLAKDGAKAVYRGAGNAGEDSLQFRWLAPDSVDQE
jgi:uncharacterized hydrophobic protein (TIGR00271 family)